MVFFRKKKAIEPEPKKCAELESCEGPVLRVVLDDKHLATLFFDGSRYGLIYHEAFNQALIAPFNPEQVKKDELPVTNKCYYSDVLWHSFSVRIPPPDRPDYLELLKKCGLTGNENPLVILSKLGSVSISKPWKLVIQKNEKVS